MSSIKHFYLASAVLAAMLIGFFIDDQMQRDNERSLKQQLADAADYEKQTTDTLAISGLIQSSMLATIDRLSERAKQERDARLILQAQFDELLTIARKQYGLVNAYGVSLRECHAALNPTIPMPTPFFQNVAPSTADLTKH